MIHSSDQPQSASPRLWPYDILAAALLALLGLMFFAATLVPGPMDGDSGEFQFMPRVLGLPHPTGFPLYLLMGWLWSWLPVETVAFRMNLLSAIFGALTLLFLFVAARRMGLAPVAAAGGAVAFSLSPGVRRYASVAEVYTLHSLLLAASLFCWLLWADALTNRRDSQAWRRFWIAALVTGTGLTNHPTFAFVVPAVGLFLSGHLVTGTWRARRAARTGDPSSTPSGHWQGRNGWRLLLGAILFALPGLLYLYVPVRLWQIDPYTSTPPIHESIARGVLSPFIRREWGMDGVIHYILDRSYVSDLGIAWHVIPTLLPMSLIEEFGLPIVLLGALGAVLWLARQPRSFALAGTLFLLSGAYGVTVLDQIRARGEALDTAAVLMGALVALSLAAAWGAHGLISLLIRLTGRARLASTLVAILLAVALWQGAAGSDFWPGAERQKSRDIQAYWTEVLAYPLEPDSAITGHWGDLTPFWYYQHGEGRRPDLRAIFPPNLPEIESWLTDRDTPVYLAGPLLGWSAELSEHYSLTPWGILVRIAPQGSLVSFPALQERDALFGEQLSLEGYRSVPIEEGRRQLWLAWQSTAPVARDLSVSVRLHGPDGTQLLQKDGRLASLWYPEGTLPPDLRFLTVFDLSLPDAMPEGTMARIVVYDPQSGIPLLSAQGQDVVELGAFETP